MGTAGWKLAVEYSDQPSCLFAAVVWYGMVANVAMVTGALRVLRNAENPNGHHAVDWVSDVIVLDSHELKTVQITQPHIHPQSPP